MNMDRQPIAELRSVLATVSEHGKHHLVEIETDLQQTTFLLGEAIEKLGVSFMTVYEAVTQQQLVIDELTAKNQIDEKEQQRLVCFKEQIGQEVNSVVTALQFQDLTTQLIGRTILRVDGLKKLLEELTKDETSMTTNPANEDIVEYLERINNMLNQGSNALSGGLMRKSVVQKDMATGDIDLF